MKTEIISVVMATYNGAQYISEQLDSIISQSVMPDEIIISDDCSKDDTLKIIEEYRNKTEIPIKLFMNDVNLGYVKNFKSVISKARGDYIFLCDQDDIWVKDKIKKTISEMKLHHAEIACTGVTLIDGEGRFITDLNVYKSNPIMGYQNWTGCVKKISFNRLVWGNFSPGCTYCFTKSVKLVFDRLKNTEMPHDFQLLLIGANHGNAIFIDIPLSEYRLHASNTIGMNKREPKRKRHVKPRMFRFFEELSKIEKIRNFVFNSLILFFRLPKIRYIVIEKLKLENKMRI